MELSDSQQAMMLGLVLGDGYLQKTGEYNARLRLEHGLKQKDYLLWKVKQLPRLFSGDVKYLSRVHPLSGRTYHYCRHQSIATPYLGNLRRLFYSDSKKIIPKELVQLLRSPLSLAIWYMDDGYYYRRDGCAYLYLGNVSRREAMIVCKLLKSNFGLMTKPLVKKRGYAIYFPRREIGKLKNIIADHLLPGFNYKIPLDPVTTSPT